MAINGLYYPYFRGKLNELITIRDNAELLAKSKIVPIIEPVRFPLNGLQRALDAVVKSQGQVVVVVNPRYGDCVVEADQISGFVNDQYGAHSSVTAAILLSDEISCEEVLRLYDIHQDNALAFIHYGFSEGKQLARQLGNRVSNIQHVFVEISPNKLYRRYFEGHNLVLVRDGFKKRKNREYPQIEFFSDLHITYKYEGVHSFGDFLIVGDDYSDSGGPAYAVAIHLTCIDPEQDDAMYIYHFVSDRQDTPSDPAGKFAESLSKLVLEAGKEHSKILKTNAVMELLDLHARGHFPGLGYVKKISMQHHIETLAYFLGNQQ